MVTAIGFEGVSPDSPDDSKGLRIYNVAQSGGGVVRAIFAVRPIEAGLAAKIDRFAGAMRVRRCSMSALQPK